MVIFLPVIIMLATAVTLTVLHFARPGFKYPWLVATGGASVAFAGVFTWHFHFPQSFTLPPWQPTAVFRYYPVWLADGTSWPYALALAALATAVIWTSVVRRENEPLSWAVTLLLSALGILAVTAGNPLTLVMAWSALDLAELLSMLRATDGENQNRSLAIALATRLSGTGLVLLASMLSLASGTPLDFRVTPPSVGIYLLIAVGLRLGVLPLHLPYRKENVLRRGLGTTLRLVSAAASLSLLARIPTSSLESRLPPFLLILAAITALYAGWMWLRASDEIIGRPFWVLGLASLAVAASLRADPVGSIGWGVVLVLSGGMLFLFSARRRSILWLLLAGVWGLSALPFSPTAAAWESANSSTWVLMLPFLIAQALFLAGFVRHALHPGETSLESQEKWVQAIYPAGLLLPGATLVLLGLWGWPGARVMGPWLVGTIAVLLSAGFVALGTRVLERLNLGGDSAQWVRILRLGWLYGILTAIFRTFRRLANLVTRTLEGEGGLLWSFLLLVLIISVLFLARAAMILILNWLALLIVATGAIGLFVSRDWRWGLGLLAGLYIGVFLLLQNTWTPSVAAAKLVTGWMACAMLALAHLNSTEPASSNSFWPQGRIFRVLTAALTLAATFAMALRLSDWLGIGLPSAWGSLLLMGLGLIHLGITVQPFRVMLGLLTVLAGFEIVYAAVENSTLVAALLSVINLGLAMAGAYFLTINQESPS